MMKKRLMITILAVFTAVAAWAADVPVPQFQAGDRVCFIGDSITHGGLYHSFIYLFYATRFPDRRWEFFNAGISGDSAGGAVKRFDWDIAPHKPTVATIMLGMNDVGIGLYGNGQTGEKIETQRQQCLDKYAANMKKLAELLKQAGCRMIFITPSIYDQTGNMATTNRFGANDALGKCGQGVRQLAAEFGGTVVDFHGPMTELNARVQAKDPAFTIVSVDRVHPGGVGYLVMAYLFLKAQQMPQLVARIAVDAKAAVAADSVNCTVSSVTGTLDGVSFECLENALPFPVPANVAGALNLIPFQKDLNQELLAVANLTPGSYEVAIDGQPVLTASAENLAKGVNLSDNPKTPMYKQALEVQKLENNRHVIMSGKLRPLAHVRHSIAPKDADPNDYEAVKKAVIEFTEKQQDNPRMSNYFRIQTDIYVKWKPREAELLADMGKAVDGIWQANKPKPHRFAIRKAPIATPPAAVSTAIPMSTAKP